MVARSQASGTSVPGTPVWWEFVTTGAALAIAGGFTWGALAVLLEATGRVSTAKVALAQAHGHVQVYGFAGLITWGVAQHFVPRLRGTHPSEPREARAGLALLACGLLLRLLSQPLLAAGLAPTLTAAGVLASGVLELAGGLVLVWTIARTLRQPAVARKRPAPLFTAALATGLAGYVAGLVFNAYNAWAAATDPFLRGLVPGASATAATTLGFYAFLLPIAFAMSTRTFPLFFRTRPAWPLLLAAGWTALLAGVASRVTATLTGTPGVRGAGDVLLAAGVLASIAGLRVFSPRRALPRSERRIWHDPFHLLVVSAHIWLAFSAFSVLGRSLFPRIVNPAVRPFDAEWHLLGAGYVTLLILGVGSHLLPGFARQRLRWPRAGWALLLLGNGAVVGRLAWSALPGTAATGWLAASAGPLAIAALVLFTLNCRLSDPLYERVTGRRDEDSLRWCR